MNRRSYLFLAGEWQVFYYRKRSSWFGCIKHSYQLDICTWILMQSPILNSKVLSYSRQDGLSSSI